MALPLRIALAVVALAAAAWLGIQAVGAHAEAQLTPIVLAPPGRLSAAQRARGTELLAEARRLNPDTAPQLSGGLLKLREGDVAGAERTFLSVTRAEPENLAAWALIARTAGSYDPALAARARSRVTALAPPVSR